MSYRKGADYIALITFFVREGREDVSVLYLLRCSIIDLNSKQCKKNIEVIAVLRSKALDCNIEPIHEGTIKLVDDNWQEYMKRY